MDLKKATLDANAIENGVWYELVPEAEGEPSWDVLIRSTHAKAVRKIENRQLEKHANTFRRGKTLKMEDADENALAILCEGIIVDWRGLTDGGAEVPFSIETAKSIFSDPAAAHLRDELTRAAQDVVMFGIDGREEDLGNSETA